MRNIDRVMFAALAALILAATMPAQDERSGTANLKYSGAGAVIETTLPANERPGTAISAAVYRTVKKTATRLVREAAVADCASALPKMNQICRDRTAAGRPRLLYRVEGGPDDAKKYSVAYIFTDERGREVDQILTVGGDLADIKPDIAAFNPDDRYLTEKGLAKIHTSPNGVIKLPIAFPQLNARGRTADDDYVERRIDEIYNWLEKADPAQIANINVEPLTEAIPNNVPLTFKVIGLRFVPASRGFAKSIRTVNIFLITDHDLPADEFAIKIAFAGAPPELDEPIVATLKGVKTILPPDASKAGGDRSLELRELRTNLDASVSFTSSVEDTRVGRETLRRRKNNAVVDLLFAPILDRPLDDDETYLFTPLFIDAKVSNGPISEKSLSLNRIILGTRYTIRWRPGEGSFNKYIFSFSGLNASDRDFKRVEGKFNFSFKPVFGALNRPLANEHVTPGPPSVLIPDGGPKLIRKGWFGYQIQPSIGFELGRVYRSRRTAFISEDGGRDLRRIVLETDMVFNLTRFANLHLNDKFYIRGETSTARYRNYFKGELVVPILISPHTAQSIFFSFERGDQPPFATPSVNALKIGYRISSSVFGAR